MADATWPGAVPVDSTVEVVANTGPYFEDLTILSGAYTNWNFNGNEVRGDMDVNALVAAGILKWTASTHPDHQGEYHLTAANTPVTSNLLVNGDMEMGEIGWAKYQAPFPSLISGSWTPSAVKVEAVSGFSHSGDKSLHVNSVDGGVAQVIKHLETTDKIRVSGYYNLVSGTVKIGYAAKHTMINPGSWQYFSYDIQNNTAPGMLLVTSTGAAEYYLDDLKIEKLDTDNNPISETQRSPFGYFDHIWSTDLSGVEVDGMWPADSPLATFGDFDSLDFNTLYVKWSGGDPTGKSVKINVTSILSLFYNSASSISINDARFIASDLGLFNKANVGYSAINRSLVAKIYRAFPVIQSDSCSLGLTDTIIKDLNPMTPTYAYVCDDNRLAFFQHNYFDSVVVLRGLDSKLIYRNNNARFRSAGILMNAPGFFDESHNLFSLDYSAVGETQIGYVEGWATTHATDFPANFSTTAVCDANNPQNCGVDPKVDEQGYPLWNSPLIDNGLDDISRTMDYLHHPIYGTADIGPFEYQPPYMMGVDKVDQAANVRMYGDGKFRNKLDPNATLMDLSIIPQGTTIAQWLDVSKADDETAIVWTLDKKKWKEDSPNFATAATAHTVGELKAGNRYTLKVDNVLAGGNVTSAQCVSGICTSDANGKINFTYTGGYSAHTFELAWVPTGSSGGGAVLTPTFPDADVTFSESDGKLHVSGLPNNTTQFVVSDKPDLAGGYWEPIGGIRDILPRFAPGATLYFKFQDSNGAQSRIYTYDRQTVPAVCYPDGTLIGATDSIKVYVMIDCKKKWIPTPEVFEQLGYQWSSVVKLASDVVYPIPDYEDNLIRFFGDQKVYLVVNGVKRHIPTPDIFFNYGFRAEDINDVPPSVIDQYREAYVIRANHTNQIYYLNSNLTKTYVSSPLVFSLLGYRWEDVQIISQYEMDFYPSTSYVF